MYYQIFVLFKNINPEPCLVYLENIYEWTPLNFFYPMFLAAGMFVI